MLPGAAVSQVVNVIAGVGRVGERCGSIPGAVVNDNQSCPGDGRWEGRRTGTCQNILDGAASCGLQQRRRQGSLKAPCWGRADDLISMKAMNGRGQRNNGLFRVISAIVLLARCPSGNGFKHQKDEKTGRRGLRKKPGFAHQSKCCELVSGGEGSVEHRGFVRGWRRLAPSSLVKLWVRYSEFGGSSDRAHVQELTADKSQEGVISRGRLFWGRV